MRSIALIFALLFSYAVSAQVPMTGAGLGAPSSGGGFAGPGDVVSGAFAYYGFRAYNAAYAAPGTNPAFQVCDISTGLTCTTINILTTGYADRATAIASAACAVSCGISSITDQTGNGNTATQANKNIFPVILFAGCPGTFQFCAQFTNAGSFNALNSANVTQAQPFTFSWVAERFGNFTAFNNVLAFGSGTVQSGFSSTANNAYVWGGSAIRNAAATNSALHAVQSGFNGASSNIMVDGVNTTFASPGTAGASAAAIKIGDDGNGDHPSILFYEAGIWPSLLTTPNQGLLNTNQHGSSGWNF